VRYRGAGFFSENNFCPGARGQFVMTANEICVQMRLDDVPDPEILRGGLVEILIHVTLRIDDGSFASRTY
jgi:hypothetical protein